MVLAAADMTDQADPTSIPNDVEGVDTAATPGGPEPDLGYRVELSGFSGPLDLLLYLVRKAEVDITEVSIVAIADQFLATIEAWEDLDLDVAGDFILMAATLLEMKARIVVPPDEHDEQDDDDDFFDPRADLIQQLLAYRRVKETVLELEDCERRRATWHHRRHQETIPEDPQEAEGMDLDNADPYQLFAAWEKVLESIAGKAPRTVIYDDIPIEDRMRQMNQLMAEAREGRLSWMFSQVSTKVQRCGVIVALLECVRQRTIETIQHEQYDDVHLRYIDEDERQRMPTLPPEEPEEEVVLDADGNPVKKKRRRRKRPPLFTWQAPPSAAADDGTQELIEEVVEETIAETEEQRFVRELNASTGIDDLLGRMKDLDGHLDRYLVAQGLIDEASQQSNEGGERSDPEAATTTAPADATADQPQARTPDQGDSAAGDGFDDNDEDDDEEEYDDDDDDEFDEDDEFDDDEDDDND